MKMHLTVAPIAAAGFLLSCHKTEKKKDSINDVTIAAIQQNASRLPHLKAEVFCMTRKKLKKLSSNRMLSIKKLLLLSLQIGISKL